MKDIELYTLFLNFLDNNNCIRAFLDEFYKIKTSVGIKTWFSNLSYKSTAIDAAFSWDNTNAGKEFWTNISTKWEDHLIENLKASQKCGPKYKSIW